METPWRWTSPSVFLLLVLNIGRILSQSVGPNCPFQLPGKEICDCNPGLVNPQLQLKSVVYPQNGKAPGGPIGLVPECLKPLCQDGFSTQNLPINQQTNYVPMSPCANLDIINSKGPSYVDPSGPAYYIPRQSLPFPQPIPQQSQCPSGRPCQSQENLRLPPLEMLPPQGILNCPSLAGTPFTPLIPVPVPGMGLSGSELCQQMDFSPCANAAILGNYFTPLIPKINLGSPPPCTDVLPSQGTPLSQDSVSNRPPVSPLLSFNNQGFPGASIDVFPFAQCPPAFNDPSINTFRPCPQSPLFPQCARNLPETQPCQSGKTSSLIDPPSQNCFPYSQFNMFQVPTTTLFPTIAPIQGSLALPCGPTCSKSSGCANPGENQPQNAYHFDCPPINPLTHVYPPIYQSNQISALPPVLPQSVYIPSYENSYKSTMADSAPIPITLQINVPAPSIPAPRITIINTVPEPSTAVSPTVDELSYFDMPPMIIEGRKSRSRSWLPLILVALFAGDGNFGGNGGGCSYDSGLIPIPYPIPIPTNNPVIVNK